jgi:membrane protein DedA with SNARE-associated domain
MNDFLDTLWKTFYVTGGLAFFIVLLFLAAVCGLVLGLGPWYLLGRYLYHWVLLRRVTRPRDVRVNEHGGWNNP